MRALLVEDVRGLARLVTATVDAQASEPVIAHWSADLSDALQRLASEPFDVVLLDLSLPDSSGIETYRRIAAVPSAPPIVVLTASDDRTLALQALREGAEDYLVKGHIDGAMLYRSLCYAVERHRRRNAERQLLHVQEEERKRIARDLHDSVIQSLLSLRMRLQGMAAFIEGEGTKLHQQLLELADDSSVAADEVRHICRDLHPEVLDARSLQEAMQWYLRKQFHNRPDVGQAIAVELSTDQQCSLPHPVKRHLFRIFQEAFRNAVGHSKASKVVVSLTINHRRVVLSVRDNGIGFQVRSRPRAGSLGLTSMRERAQLIGGHLKIDSQPGRGTKIIVTAPHHSCTPRPQ